MVLLFHCNSACNQEMFFQVSCAMRTEDSFIRLEERRENNQLKELAVTGKDHYSFKSIWNRVCYEVASSDAMTDILVCAFFLDIHCLVLQLAYEDDT